MNVLIFISFIYLGCYASIILHELGHFIIGKCLRLKIVEYNVGHGLVLFRCKRYDTTFTLNLIPICGHCTFINPPITPLSEIKYFSLALSGILVNYLVATTTILIYFKCTWIQSIIFVFKLLMLLLFPWNSIQLQHSSLLTQDLPPLQIFTLIILAINILLIIFNIIPTAGTDGSVMFDTLLKIANKKLKFSSKAIDLFQKIISALMTWYIVFLVFLMTSGDRFNLLKAFVGSSAFLCGMAIYHRKYHK